MKSPSRKLDGLAEQLLETIDLLKVYPRYPLPEQAGTTFLTSANYLHQLCLVATTPTLLLWLMRSLALALKRLCLEEMARHHQYYHFFHDQQLHLEQLNTGDPNDINPYLSLALQRSLGIEFIQIETQNNKQLPKVFYLAKMKTSLSRLIVHREKQTYLCAAVVEHHQAFAPLMSHEHTRFLYQELENYRAPLHSKELYNHFFLDHYALIKRAFSELNFSLDELKTCYFDVLDQAFETTLENKALFFLDGQQSLQFASQRMKANTMIPLSLRLHQELEATLCRLIALNITSTPALLNQPTLKKIQQYKTFLTKESDNVIMTSSEKSLY